METNKKYGKLDESGKISYAEVPFRVVRHHKEEWTDPEGHSHVEEWDETYMRIHPSEEELNLMSFYEIISKVPVEEGYYFTSTEFGDLAENKIVRRYGRRENPKEVRRWTPLAIKRAAKKKGWWEQLHQALIAANLLEDFWGAQFIAEDDQDFPAIYEGMAKLFGKAEVDEFLKGLERA